MLAANIHCWVSISTSQGFPLQILTLICGSASKHLCFPSITLWPNRTSNKNTAVLCEVVDLICICSIGLIPYLLYLSHHWKRKWNKLKQYHKLQALTGMNMLHLRCTMFVSDPEWSTSRLCRWRRVRQSACCCWETKMFQVMGKNHSPNGVLIA